MRVKLSALALFILIFATCAFAETTIKAEVDKASITTDSALTYRLTITTNAENVPQPVMPGFKGFNVISSAQSSNMAFSGGQVHTTLVYAFILAPTGVGTLRISPARINVANKDYFSKGFDIEVRQGKARPQLPQEPTPSIPKKAIPRANTPQITI